MFRGTSRLLSPVSKATIQAAKTEQVTFFKAITHGVEDPDTFSYRAALWASLKPTSGSLVHKVPREPKVSIVSSVKTEQVTFLKAIINGVEDPDKFSYRAALWASLTPRSSSVLYKVLYGVKDRQDIAVQNMKLTFVDLKVMGEKAKGRVAERTAVLAEASKVVQTKGVETVVATKVVVRQVGEGNGEVVEKVLGGRNVAEH